MNRRPRGAAIAGAARYVRDHPGCCKRDVQQAGWPSSSVEAAIAAGLVRAQRAGHYRYRLYPGDGTPLYGGER